MLYPPKVGIATRWHSILPSRIIGEDIDSPVRLVKWRIGDDKIRLEVRMTISEKRSLRIPADKLRVDIADREIHLGELPGGLIGLLPVDSDVFDITLMLLDKFFAHDKHTTGPTSWIVDSALVGLDHLDHELDDRFWCVELTSLFSLSIGKLSEKILIDPTKEVF